MPNSSDIWRIDMKNEDYAQEKGRSSEENQAKKGRFVRIFAPIFLPNLSFTFSCKENKSNHKYFYFS